MDRLGLTLITGPANAGKVALLLRRYLDSLDREPMHPVNPETSSQAHPPLRQVPGITCEW